MRRATLPYVKGQIAITLGRIGDGRAIPALVHVLQDAQEPHLNRAIACAALGLLGERGLHSTFAPVRWDAMYLSSSALVYDVLDVL
jgi:HEAT repeat protein